MISSLPSLLFSDMSCAGFRAGDLKKIQIKTLARKPIATILSASRYLVRAGVWGVFYQVCIEPHSRRFTQKQNRQVNLSESVNTPPSKGPATEATPNMLVTPAK